MIHLNKVSVTFQGVERIDVLADVTFSIQQGEWVTISGPSGSGKTTLLNVIGGMIECTSGQATVNNNELFNMAASDLQTFRRETIGYIFQNYRLFEQYTVLENVMVPQWPYRPRKQIEVKAKKVLDKLNMGHRLHHLPSALSGGEKQRAAIARAMLHDPAILLCDEPTGNLDTENRDNILGILSELHKENMTILLVTHDSEVGKYGDREFKIRDGMLTELMKV